MVILIISTSSKLGVDAMKKNRWKRLLTVFLVMICLLSLVPQQVQAEEYWPKGPKTESKSAILMEVNTGTILYEKKSHKEHYPASITKIMTCLLTIENCDMDEEVVFSADAVYKNEGDTSNIGRDLGEVLTVEQCLYAVMLESANECAYALAEHVGEKMGGDYRTFIQMMNDRAKALGCENTHFNNSNGLPDEEHWVSAYDMALISIEAYKNEEFRKITGSTSYSIPKTNKCKEVHYGHNHHKMLYPFRGDDTQLYEYCTGGKTGYTTAANSTLVSYAEKDGLTLVCVVMDANTPAHYTDTRKLFDFGFENFQALGIAEHDAVVGDSAKKDYGLMNNNEPYAKLDENAYIVMPKTAEFSDAQFEEDKENTESGTLARLKYTYAGRVVGQADIVATGAKVDNSYFEQKDAGKEDAERVVRITPVMFVIGFVCVVALALLIYFGKKLYDNFYVIRHNIQMRRMEKARFRVTKRKKRYRKRDRMFK